MVIEDLWNEKVIGPTLHSFKIASLRDSGSPIYINEKYKRNIITSGNGKGNFLSDGR
jgi:hypothetical protein